MPPLNFYDRFKADILSGKKWMTIRLLWKCPIKVGDKLYLYAGLRTRKPELLKITICTCVGIWRWGEIKNNLGLAELDGFDSLEDFQKWFADLYRPTDDTKFMLVFWETPVSDAILRDISKPF